MNDLELEERGGIGSFSNCTNLSNQDIRLLALARGGAGAACFAVCVLALLAVVCARGLAGLRGSTQTRLMSYLLLSTAAYLMVLSAHMEHYWNYRGGRRDFVPRHMWQVHLCEAIGMADQYTGSVQLFFVVGVSGHFVYHSFDIFFSISNKGLSPKQKVVLETLLVVVSLVGPALYVWIPFIAVPYGETGPWCWIRTLNRQCHDIKGSFWEQMGIWYIPFGITAVFSLFAIILFLLSVRYRFIKIRKHRGQKKGEAIVLIVFLSTHSLLFVIEFVSHLISTVKKADYFGVWMLYAVSTPLGVVSLPIGLLVYTFTGTLREAAKQYIRCHCIRRTPVFINLFRNTSSFTRVASHDSE